MSAFVIARVNVTNADQYEKYKALAPATIARYQGEYVARGGEVATFEGAEETNRVVVLRFASMEAAKTWYHSPEYQAAKAEREGAADGQFIVVEGL